MATAAEEAAERLAEEEAEREAEERGIGRGIDIDSDREQIPRDSGIDGGDEDGEGGEGGDDEGRGQGNDEDFNRLEDEEPEAMEERKNSKFKSAIGKIVDTIGVKKLIAAAIVGVAILWLADGAFQSESQCDCNYERTKAQCSESPPAPYSGEKCKDCDTSSPKSCCRTCKDILNSGMIDLSFLGTDDIIDLKDDECKGKSKSQCCSSTFTRAGRSYDDVIDCLINGIESFKWYIYGAIIIYLVITCGPSLYRLFGNNSKEATSDNSSLLTTIMPFLTVIIGLLVCLVINYTDPDLFIYSSWIFFGGAFLLLILFFINFSGIRKDEERASKIIYMDDETSYSGFLTVFIFLLPFLSLSIYCLYKTYISQPLKPPTTPPGNITTTSNILIDKYLYDLDVGNNNISSGYLDCFKEPFEYILSLISPNQNMEGLDNSSQPDCPRIDSKYDNTIGDKTYYCFLNGCGYDGNKCVTAPQCSPATSDTNSDDIKDYMITGIEMISIIISFKAAAKIGSLLSKKAADKAAGKAATAAADAATEKVIVEKSLEKVGAEATEEAIPGIDLIGWIPIALDVKDFCKYQSFVSNTDIKNNWRNIYDTYVNDKSKPTFFPLSELKALEGINDSGALPFQILYKAYVSWMVYYTTGISEVLLDGDTINDYAAKIAYGETTNKDYCTFQVNYNKEFNKNFTNIKKQYYGNHNVIQQINTDDPKSLTSSTNDMMELQQIQMWKYIYRYCVNGGMYTIISENGKKLVLYNGEKTDGTTNLPDLWNTSVDGIPALSTYIINIQTLNSIKNLGQNGPVVTLSELGARDLKKYLSSRNSYGKPCNNATDKNEKCILDDLVINISNVYRDYSLCNGKSGNCTVYYRALPNGISLPLYYPSSKPVNTLCRYATRGMKWIQQRNGGLSKSSEEIQDIFSGINEVVDNSTVLGEEYYNPDTGLCNYTQDYCDSKACRNLYCYPDKNRITNNNSCSVKNGMENGSYTSTYMDEPGGEEVFSDCENTWYYDAISGVFSDTITCNATHLLDSGSLHC